MTGTAFGHVAAKGIEKLPQLLTILETADLPDLLRAALRSLTEQIAQADRQIDGLTKAILEQAKTDQRSRMMDEVPGIGPLTASLLAASVPDIKSFPSARHFAAWLGLAPRQNSSGGKTRLGKISKTGNVALRCHLVLGATSLLKLAAAKAPPPRLAWATELLKRKSYRLASVALANKLARILWALLTHGEAFNPDRWSASAIA